MRCCLFSPRNRITQEQVVSNDPSRMIDQIVENGEEKTEEVGNICSLVYHMPLTTIGATLTDLDIN